MNRVRAWPSIAVGLALWIGVIAAATAGVRTSSLGLLGLMFVIVCGLQNSLQSLLHEGAHGLVHPARRANDAVTELLFGIPFFQLLRHYRKFHLAHHRHVGDPERDPELGFYAEQGYRFQPLPARALVWMLCKDVCGYHFMQFLWAYNRYLYGETRAGRMGPLRAAEWGRIAIVVGVIAGVASVPGGVRGILQFWFLPQMTGGFLLLKLQGYAEHTGHPRHGRTGPAGAWDQTWSHRYGGWARVLVQPLGAAYHGEHHRQPSVPWYRLAKLRSEINARDPVSLELRLDGYLGGARSVLRTILWENTR